LIITTEFPPYVGGAGTYSYTLAKALAARGNRVTVLTRSYTSETQENLDKDLEKANVACIRLQWIKRLSLHVWKKKIRFHLDKKRYDLVIISNDGAQMICSSTKIREKLGYYFVVIHGTEIARYFEQKANPFFLFFSRKGMICLLSGASRVVAVSNSTKEWLLEHVPLTNVTVILNCIDTSLFYYEENFIDKRKALLTTLGIKDTEKILMTASRLIREKGQDVLISVFSRLRQKFNNLKLIICSDGPCRTSLEQQAKDLDLTDYIIFTGKVPVATLRDLYQLSDIFILLSRQGRKEGFGLVYLEANACKTPVIGPDLGGVRDAIAQGVNGLRVNPCDLEEIGEKIKMLLCDESLRSGLAEKGYKRVCDYFHESRLAEDFLKEISNCGFYSKINDEQ
jgi:glycosyltransferase involved in cell wall biosynthesis